MNQATPEATLAKVKLPPGVRIRIHGRSFELRAYGGTNPATDKPQHLTERLSLDTAPRDLGEAALALAARAAELKATRRVRRKEGGHVELPSHKVRERTVAEALDGWFAERGQDLARADEAERAIRMFKAVIGDAELWRLRGSLDATDDPAVTADLVDLTAVRRDLIAGGSDGDRPLAPSTVKGRFSSVLSPALARAVRRGWLPTNPCREMTPLASKKAEATPDLDPEPVGEFLAFLARHQSRLYTFALLVASGPRPFEACAIRRGNLDLEAGELRLLAEGVVKARRVKGEPERWVVEAGETTKRRRRMIMLDPILVEALRDVVRDQDRVALETGIGPLSRRAFVFSNDHYGEKPVNPHSMGTLFDRYVARARGLEAEPGRGRRQPSSHKRPRALRRPEQVIDLPEKFSLYSMRHDGISSMLAAGRRPKAVAERYATSEDMLYREYSHLIKGEDAALAEAMGQKWATVAERISAAAAGGDVIPLHRPDITT